MRVVFWVLTVIAAAAFVAFAVANRQSVSLGLWPLPFLVEAPVYLVVLLTLLAGFVIGAVAAWIGGRRSRRQLRRRRRRIEALERELAATQAQLTHHPERASSERPV